MACLLIHGHGDLCRKGGEEIGGSDVEDLVAVADVALVGQRSEPAVQEPGGGGGPTSDDEVDDRGQDTQRGEELRDAVPSTVGALLGRLGGRVASGDHAGVVAAAAVRVDVDLVVAGGPKDFALT